MRIVCTGSEGFIGQHVISKLLALGHEVIGVDHLDPQVHKDGFTKERPYAFEPISVSKFDWDAVEGVDVVLHLAAKVGVGQSMYQIDRYVDDNVNDTAIMLKWLADNPPKRLIVASSMSIYGEGPRHYDYTSGKPQTSEEMFEMGLPAPCHEDCPPDLRSIYALTKYDQEQLCLIWGKAYNVPTVALRFFNTYGPGQSLTNPYTGVMAIFATRLLNDKPPIIYEDGQQSRDFIHVDDVAWAVVNAAIHDIPSGAYNVGTGFATTIMDLAVMLANRLGKFEIQPIITGQHRKGDIRHCFADLSKIEATGWWPKIKLEQGLREYCEWLLTQPIPTDTFDQAHAELLEKGLTK